MSAKRIGTFLETVFQGSPKKRQQTLAVLMAALGSVGKVGVASLGRAIRSRVAFEHGIEQVDRWTKVGPWPVLVVSVVTKRRGIPVYWATWVYRRMTRSQNAFEESFLTCFAR